MSQEVLNTPELARTMVLGAGPTGGNTMKTPGDEHKREPDAPLAGSSYQAERGTPVRQVRVRRFGTGSAVIPRVTLVRCTTKHPPPWDVRDLTRYAEICQEFSSGHFLYAQGMELNDTPIEGRVPGEANHSRRPRGSARCPRVGSWALAGLLLLVAAAMLGLAVATDGVLALDPPLARIVQEPDSGFLDALATVVSRIGDVSVMVAIALTLAAFLAVRGRRELALFLVIAASLRAFGPELKRMFGSPRPPADLLTVLEQSDGFGYPSGHALGAALLYGAIAVIAPEVVQSRMLAKGIQVAAAAMILLTALARVRLGVHWPSDVVGGVLFGLGFVLVLFAALGSWRAARIKM